MKCVFLMYFVNLRIRKRTTIFDNSTKSCGNSVDPGGGEDVAAAASASAAAAAALLLMPFF